MHSGMNAFAIPAILESTATFQCVHFSTTKFAMVAEFAITLLTKLPTHVHVTHVSKVLIVPSTRLTNVDLFATTTDHVCVKPKREETQHQHQHLLVLANVTRDGKEMSVSSQQKMLSVVHWIAVVTDNVETVNVSVIPVGLVKIVPAAAPLQLFSPMKTSWTKFQH
jgi:hypothetical protein